MLAASHEPSSGPTLAVATTRSALVGAAVAATTGVMLVATVRSAERSAWGVFDLIVMFSVLPGVVVGVGLVLGWLLDVPRWWLVAIIGPLASLGVLTALPSQWLLLAAATTLTYSLTASISYPGVHWLWRAGAGVVAVLLLAGAA